MKLCHLRQGLCASPTVGTSVACTERQHNVLMEQPVYMKPSRSRFRKPSFFFPRMRGGFPTYAYKAPPLSTASPMFCITSSSCEYYALRLPLLKAGFKRLHTHLAHQIPSNLLWGRSLLLCPQTSPNQTAGSNGGELQLPSASTMPLDGAGSGAKLQMVCTHQRFNHFPRTYGVLGCKLGLTQRLRHVKKSLERDGVKKELYNFFPKTWIFPEERESLASALSRAKPTQRFIWKPARGSCGRGIFVCPGGEQNASQWNVVLQKMGGRISSTPLTTTNSYVVQEYIDDPLLLEGRKMDLRLYVAVTSYDPLTVYLHEEGLVRLAVHQYVDSVSGECGESDAVESCTLRFNPFRDLTNYSIGRKWARKGRQVGSSDECPEVTDVISNGEGCDVPEVELKKSMGYLWAHVDGLGSSSQKQSPSSTACGDSEPLRPSDQVWSRIAEVIVKTLLAVKSPMSRGTKCVTTPGSFFELYGFDMMIDSKLNPWLVEVNTLPSLASTSTFDYIVKTNIISDLLNLAMIEPFERPVSCLKDVVEGQGLHHMGLCNSLTGEAAESVHRWRGYYSGNSNSAPEGDREKREEIWLRLQDELSYCRGFRRIFPPLHLSVSPSIQLKDVEVLAPHVGLTKRDIWALEA